MKRASINKPPQFVVKFCLPTGTGEWEILPVRDGKPSGAQLLKKRFVNSGFNQDNLLRSDLIYLFDQLVRT